MSGSRLCEGGDIYSPEGQSTATGSQQDHFGFGSQQRHSGSSYQQGHVGEDANQQHQGCHQFQYFFIKFVQLFFTHVFSNIRNYIYIDAEAENV